MPFSSIYLNHAGTSWPKPKCVVDAVQYALQHDPAYWPEQFSIAHQNIAQFFHVKDASRLLLTPGCTSALSVAVADHEWHSGDRVLTSGLEHHALHRPLSKLVERGVSVEVLPVCENCPMDLEKLEQELRTGRVKMLAFAAANNITGALVPIPEIVSLAKKYGVITLVDGAQIAGWWDIDLPLTQIDLFAFAGHKGLQAPWGIGGLYVSPQCSMVSPNATCDISLPNKPCATMPGYCDVGSVDRLALAGLSGAVDWLSQSEQSTRLDTARKLSTQLAEYLKDLPDVCLLSSIDAGQRMPTVSFTMKNHLPTEFAKQLARQGLIVGAGLLCSPLAHHTLGTEPDGVVRLSVGPQTTADDIGKAITILGIGTQIIS